MGTVPSSTGVAGSDGPGPPLACVLHPTRRAATDSTAQLSFKARARTQILRLHRQLLDEREKHEQVVEELRKQNKKDVVSLSSRVEDFEAQWARLQRRMSELWLEVEGLKMAEHTYPTSNASAQLAHSSVTNTSTQTQEISSSHATTQTDEDTRSNLKLWLGTATENELKRWRTAFSEQSGTPEQMALRSKLTDKELGDWRTAFEHIQGTPAQKAASSKEAIDELKEWRTSFNHVSGTPAQRAAASKKFFGNFQHEQKKSSRLSLSEDAVRRENKALKREIRELEHDNPQRRRKRKREVSEPDGQQEEPLPTFQTRRIEYGNHGWDQRGREGTAMAQWAAPRSVFGYQGFPVLPTRSSIPPTGGPMGSWGEPARYQYYAPPGYPMVPSGSLQRPFEGRAGR